MQIVSLKSAEIFTQIAKHYKVPIIAAADNIWIFCMYFFSEKIRFDISDESSARKTIYSKCQALFFSKKKL